MAQTDAHSELWDRIRKDVLRACAHPIRDYQHAEADGIAGHVLSIAEERDALREELAVTRKALAALRAEREARDGQTR